jgi:hypothetical protein
MAANQSRRRADPTKDSDINVPVLGESTLEFQYQPLDSSVDCTRLLEFEPIGIAKWGNETAKKTIFVDGKKFLVGQNLWDALRFLRKRANGQRYWIDAICINQTDIPERSRQLTFMPEIYARAQMVLVWLGSQYDSYL